jgi:putative membrane protein insertion efficiency factor
MTARILLFLIRLYQRVLSPLLGPVCRFEPSCSRYTATCIARFGALRGTALGARRVLRCNPFFPGGIDLPPEVFPGGIDLPPEPSQDECSAHRAAASSCVHVRSLR